MNVLAIGNSFSQDATRYLHQIAKSDGVDLTVVNLCIGGCPLYTHYKNMLTDAKVYSMEFNGEFTGFFVSISEALLAREWDYVTFQQVSHNSNDFETYVPYITALSEYVKKYSPKAKQMIHQTWAYEDGSKRLCEEMGYKTSSEMFSDVKNAYEKAAALIDAPIIESGRVFYELIKNGLCNMHRDTFHAALGKGRYALGLMWYASLTGNDVTENKFNDFDEAITDDEMILIKETVNKIAGEKF